MFPGQRADDPGSMQAFDGLADFRKRLFRGAAPGQRQAEAAVAGLVIGTGQHQVSHAGQTHKGVAPPPQCLSQAHNLGQPPGHQRSPGVGAVAQAIGNAGGDCHDIFHRAADLHADNVIMGISPEYLAMKQRGKPGGGGRIPRGDGNRSGQTLGHFPRERRS